MVLRQAGNRWTLNHALFFACALDVKCANLLPYGTLRESGVRDV